MSNTNTIEEALNIFNKNYNHQIILYGPPGTSKTYSSTIIAASFLAAEDKEYKEAKSFLKNNDHYQIVQFHPSYNYDDFVRGIKMSIQEGNPRYDVVNKIFGEFAEKAEKDNWMHQLAMKLQACKESGGKLESPISEIDTEIKKIREYLNDEKSNIVDITKNLENIKLKYSCMEKVDANNKDKEIEDTINNLKKNLDPLNMGKCKVLLDEIEEKIKSDVDKISEELDSLKTYNEHNKKNVYEQIAIIQGLLEDLRAELYNKVIESLYGKYKEENEREDIIKLLNQKSRYVMVIDEINRAPLASVLGEMIYGLEYRDQPISTSYKLENGSEKIVIPDNLYIIGTMNTADRSIGTIDYAVRRRFAFIPVLPDWNVVKNSWNEIELKDENGKDQKREFLDNLARLWNKLDPESSAIIDNSVSNDSSDKTYTNGVAEQSEEESTEIPAEDGNSNKTGDKELACIIKYNSDIEVSDVQIGHTYFVYNEEKCKDYESAVDYIKYRLDYEIKPILLEYKNDEIITNSKEDIQGIKFEFDENKCEKD